MTLPRSLILAKDFSEDADRALHYALSIASKNDALLHIVYVDVLARDVFQTSGAPSGPVDKVRAHLKRTLNRAYEKLPYDPESLRIKHHVVRGTPAGSAILQLASKHATDLIVMGTRGRGGARRLLLGSVATEVVRSAPCNVLTIGTEAKGDPEAFRRILAPVDLSAASRRGLRTARQWADAYEAQLNVLTVTHPRIHPDLYAPSLETIYDVTDEAKKNMMVRLEAFYEEVGGPSVDVSFHVLTGEAGSEVINFERRNEHDLIIMSSHGHSGFARFALGSVSDKIVRLASSPVLVARPNRSDEEEPEVERASAST